MKSKPSPKKERKTPGGPHGTAQILFNAILHGLASCNHLGDLEDHTLKRADLEKTFFTKNAKKNLLGGDYLSELFLHQHPLVLVLTMHLFVEAFLDEIIKRKFHDSKRLFQRREFTFSFKLDLLKSKNYLDEALFRDISLLNSLRNKYSHKLTFGIGEFDFSQFTYCQDVYQWIQHYDDGLGVRDMVHPFLLRYILYFLLDRMTDRHPFLSDLKSFHFEDVAGLAGSEDDIPF